MKVGKVGYRKQDGFQPLVDAVDAVDAWLAVPPSLELCKIELFALLCR